MGYKAKSCCLSFSRGTDSPKLCSLEKSDGLQVQSKRFSHSQCHQASAHLFAGSSKPRLAAVSPGLLHPSGCTAKGTRSVSQPIRIPRVLHKSLPSGKPIFSEVKNSYQLLGRPKTWAELGQSLRAQKWYEKPSWWLSALPFSMVYPIYLLSIQMPVSRGYHNHMPSNNEVGFCHCCESNSVPHPGNKAICSILSKSKEFRGAEYWQHSFREDGKGGNVAGKNTGYFLRASRAPQIFCYCLTIGEDNTEITGNI